MEAAEEGVQAGHRGRSLSVSDAVVSAGMCAPGHHDKAFAAHLDHESLIVEYRRVWFPGGFVPVLVGWGACRVRSRRCGRSCGDQHRQVEQLLTE
jgi:hypothetical protein